MLALDKWRSPGVASAIPLTDIPKDWPSPLEAEGLGLSPRATSNWWCHLGKSVTTSLNFLLYNMGMLAGPAS